MQQLATLRDTWTSYERHRLRLNGWLLLWLRGLDERPYDHSHLLPLWPDVPRRLRAPSWGVLQW